MLTRDHTDHYIGQSREHLRERHVKSIVHLNGGFRTYFNNRESCNLKSLFIKVDTLVAYQPMILTYSRLTDSQDQFQNTTYVKSNLKSNIYIYNFSCRN